METWFLIISTLFISAILKAFFSLIFPSPEPGSKLPPGPPKYPIIGNLLWLHRYKSFSDLGPSLRSLNPKFGPMLTLHVTSYLTIFVSDGSIARQALIENASLFADRPQALANGNISTSNQFNIGSASYGSIWRILRSNLTAEIFNPSRINSYSQARLRVLHNLKKQLIKSQNTGDRIHVLDYFRHALIGLLGLMSFGLHLLEKLRLWEELLQIRKNGHDVFIQLIRARWKTKEENCKLSYVDTLLDLKHPDEENRKLDEGEIVSLCAEFFNAGTDPTTTTLEWIMANLVKYPHVQEKLYTEIKGVVGDAAEEVKEDDLHKMPYIKAVVLEGLRRHPPAHFLFHAVTKYVIFNDFLVPRKGIIVFFIEEMGLDSKIWEDPLAFNPERFLDIEEDVDLTGRKGIKMIPFGAGRRICPAHSLAMVHLVYFVGI
ncbi:hypothetical protein PTKIN_Ptkin01aG0395500 [Pterospermum kingtungense]